MKRFKSGVMVFIFSLAAILTRAADRNSAQNDSAIQCIEPIAATGSSKAVVVNPAPLAHTSQLLPFNKKHELVGKGDIAKQTKRTLENLRLALRAGESSIEKIAKLNIYIRTAELRADVEKILAKTFSGKIKPAVTFVAGELPHPDALVAMDAVAVSTWQDAKVRTVRSGSIYSTKNPHVAILPANGAVYVAGLADKGEITEATRKTLEKLESAIDYLGLKRGDIVQLKAFLDPMSDVAKVRAEMEKYFSPAPAPTLVFVSWVASSVPIEIEMIAASNGKKDENATNSISYFTPTGATASPVYSRLAQINFGKRIYISGLYGTGDAENDVKEIYAQMTDLVKKAGSDFDHLAKATYYYSDLKSNARLDAFRPTIYNPKTPPTASKVRVKDVGLTGKGIEIDMIGVTVK